MFPMNSNNVLAGVNVTPRDPARMNSQTAANFPVTLWFIGVKLMRPHLREIEVDGEVEEIGRDGIKRTKKGLVKKTIVEAYSAPIMMVRGRAMQIPPIGSAMTVPKIVADELIRDGQWPDARTNKIYAGFTTSEVEARAVKKLWEDACERDLTTAVQCVDGTRFETAVATEHLDSMSDEELLAQLAARRGVNPEVLAQLLGSEEIEVPADEGEDEPEKPKRGRSSKSES